MIETTVSQRRVLDSERQRKETQDQRKAREVYHHISVFGTCSETPLSDRTLWLDVQPSSQKLLTLSDHFIALFARNSSRTSLSMTSIPILMPTTTRHA